MSAPSAEDARGVLRGPCSAGCVVAAVGPLAPCEQQPELDESIIGAARTLVRALAEVPVILCHAIAAARPASARVPGAPSPTAHNAAHRAAVERRLREMAVRHDIPLDSVRVEWGSLDRSLPIFAREARAQMVAMGALECDVLIMKPEGFRSPVSTEPAPAVPRPV